MGEAQEGSDEWVHTRNRAGFARARRGRATKATRPTVPSNQNAAVRASLGKSTRRQEQVVTKCQIGSLGATHLSRHFDRRSCNSSIDANTLRAGSKQAVCHDGPPLEPITLGRCNTEPCRHQARVMVCSARQTWGRDATGQQLAGAGHNWLELQPTEDLVGCSDRR